MEAEGREHSGFQEPLGLRRRANIREEFRDDSLDSAIAAKYNPHRVNRSEQDSIGSQFRGSLPT